MGDKVQQGNTPHAYGHSRGREFLCFIADNEAELKRAVRKNITYDPELFDDAFHTAIVKVYNAIESGRDVADFKQYFFITAKWEYINRDNRSRLEKGHRSPVSAANTITLTPDLTADVRPILTALRREIDATCGQHARRVYEMHQGGQHFTEIGRATDTNPRAVARTFWAVDSFVKSDPKCRQLRQDFREMINPDE